MKSIIKMLGLAFFATLAFGAFGATSAFAAEETLPAVLPSGSHTFPIFFKSRALGHVLLNTAARTLECTSVLDLGFILSQPSTTHSMLGDIHFIFHGCRDASTNFSCNSAGQPAGLIETKLYLFHIGRLLTLPSGKKDVLIVILISKTEFECSALAKVEIEGNLVGLIPETNAGGGNQFNKQNTELLAEFTQLAAGKQSFTTFENTLPIETLSSLHLTMKLNGGAGEETSEVGTDDETVEPAGETVELKVP